MQNLMYIVYLIISMMAAVIGILLFAKSGEENYSLKEKEDTVSNKDKYKFFFTSWAIIVFVALNLIEAFSYFII